MLGSQKPGTTHMESLCSKEQFWCLLYLSLPKPKRKENKQHLPDLPETTLGTIQWEIIQTALPCNGMACLAESDEVH